MDIKIDLLLKKSQQSLLSRLVHIKTIKDILSNKKDVSIQFSIKGDCLYVKGTPLVKNSIMLRKKVILEEIKNSTDYIFRDII